MNELSEGWNTAVVEARAEGGPQKLLARTSRACVVGSEGFRAQSIHDPLAMDGPHSSGAMRAVS